MTKNVIQVRMPRWLIEGIEKLVRGGVYKNRGEVVVDAVRHFLGGNQKKVSSDCTSNNSSWVKAGKLAVVERR